MHRTSQCSSQSCARPIRVYPILPTKTDRTDGQIDKEGERGEKGEEGERERERKQNNMPERLPASTKDGGGQGL